MKKNYTSSNYPNGNLKSESYTEGDVSITKLFHNMKKGYVNQYISLENGIKEIKHFNTDGVLAKIDYFKGDKREGIETKYLVSKANKTVKSTKTYHEGKLHGESTTYNVFGQIIKQEVFVDGKSVLQYKRDDAGKIIGVDFIDEKSITKLPQSEQEIITEKTATLR